MWAPDPAPAKQTPRLSPFCLTAFPLVYWWWLAFNTQILKLMIIWSTSSKSKWLARGSHDAKENLWESWFTVAQFWTGVAENINLMYFWINIKSSTTHIHLVSSWFLHSSFKYRLQRLRSRLLTSSLPTGSNFRSVTVLHEPWIMERFQSHTAFTHTLSHVCICYTNHKPAMAIPLLFSSTINVFAESKESFLGLSAGMNR